MCDAKLARLDYQTPASRRSWGSDGDNIRVATMNKNKKNSNTTATPPSIGRRAFTVRASSSVVDTMIYAAAVVLSAALLLPSFARQAEAQSMPAATATAATTPAAPTAIVRLFPGLSYVRLANLAGDAPVTHALELYGLDTRTTLGRVQVTVPAKGAVQFSPRDMLPGLPPADLDQFMALYIDAAPPGQFWQHVRFDPANGAFSDATVCATGDDAADRAARPAAAINVHTDRIARYASFVTVHNAGAAPVSLQARLTHARTGERIGTIAIDLPPRGTHSASGVWYQLNGGLFLPTAEQQHFNIEFVAADGTTLPRLIVGHEVRDLFANQSTNLSTLCALG